MAQRRRRSARPHIGCSGWEYSHWRGLFYPKDLPKGRWLEHYSKVFDTVEINNSFYRLPSRETVEDWRRRAPSGFIFAFKASRYLTHMRKLKDPVDPLGRVLDRASVLDAHLGPILYQLPPRWRCNLDRLREFVGLLPVGTRHAMEFRDASWYEEDVLRVLSERDVALVLHDMPGSTSPRVVSASFVYIRLHGVVARYGGGYPSETLQDWSEWMRSQLAAKRDLYVYFNNDVGGHAPKDASTLREYLT